MNTRINKKNKSLSGQYVVELSIMFVCIIGAVLAMQAYFNRGIQGRLKENVDNIGKQYDANNSNESYAMSVSSTATTVSTSEEVGAKIKSNSSTTTSSTTSVNSSETLGAF